MNTHSRKPGFELIFSLSLIAIMGLPPLVFAQNTRNMDITIIGGDTTINGKNIRELSPEQRKQALNDIGNLSAPEYGRRQRNIHGKNAPADTGKIVIKRRFYQNEDMADRRNFFSDTSRHEFKFKLRRPGGADSTFTFNYKMNTEPDGRSMDRDFFFDRREPGRGYFRRRNVQSFEYSNTGSDGISTHTSFRISDAAAEKIGTMTAGEKAGLELQDLNLVPEYSSGKTLLMFKLLNKSVAEVKFTDSEGKAVWNEKAQNGSFSKSFPLGLNGVYFLQVKQEGKTALKRIVKEE